MAMPIDQLMVSPGASVYYDPQFRVVLETHMGWLRSLDSTVVRAIDQHLAYKHEFDFYGLLQASGIPEHLHWITLRVNDMIDPREFKAATESILVPSNESIDYIRRMYLTRPEKI